MITEKEIDFILHVREGIYIDGNTSIDHLKDIIKSESKEHIVKYFDEMLKEHNYTPDKQFIDESRTLRIDNKLDGLSKEDVKVEKFISNLNIDDYIYKETKHKSLIKTIPVNIREDILLLIRIRIRQRWLDRVVSDLTERIKTHNIDNQRYENKPDYSVWR